MLTRLPGRIVDMRRAFPGPIFLFLFSHCRHLVPDMVFLSTETTRWEHHWCAPHRSGQKQRLIGRSAGRSVKKNRQGDDMQIAGNFLGLPQLPVAGCCLSGEPIFDAVHQSLDIDNWMPRKNLRQSVSQVADEAFARPAVQIETEFKCIFFQTLK